MISHIFNILLFFFLQKDSYFNLDDIDAFFLFLLQEDLYICPKPCFVFFLFLLQKDFGTFAVLPFYAFVCFLIIFVGRFYICIQKSQGRFFNRKKLFVLYVHKKIIKNIFIGFKNKLWKVGYISIFLNFLY